MRPWTCTVRRHVVESSRHGSPVSRAERKLLQASTVEPDLDHASAGRHLKLIPCPLLLTERARIVTAFPSPRQRTTTRWRVVDIVVAAVIGVAAGLVFLAWNLGYQVPGSILEAALPGLQGLVNGVWLFAGVLGGLIIRKPGAAIFTEVVAAVVSALIGNQWGSFLTFEAGVVPGPFPGGVFFASPYPRLGGP